MAVLSNLHITMRTALQRQQFLMAVCGAAVLSGVGVGILSVVLVQRSTTLGLLLPIALAGVVLMVAIGQVKRPLLALLAFSIPLHIDISFLYRDHDGGPPALIISLTNMILALLVFLLLSRAGVRREMRLKSFPRVTVLIVIFFVFCLLSILPAIDPLLTTFQVFEVVKGMILYLVLINCVRDQRDITWVIGGLVASLFLQSAIGLFHGVTRGDRLGLTFIGEIDVSSLPEDADVVLERSSGTFFHSNNFAMYLGMVVPVVSGMLLAPIRKYLKLTLMAVVCMALMSLFYTQSRGGWVGFGVSACIMGYFAVRKRYIQPAYILMLFGLGIGGLTVFDTLSGNLITARIVSDGGSVQVRERLNEGALVIIADHPVIGSGLNNYMQTVREYDDSGEYTNRGYLPVVHNVFLLLGAEIGLMGVGAFISLLIVLIRQTWSFAWSSGTASFSGLAVGLMASFQHVITHNMVEFGLVAESRLFTLFWFLAGLAVAITQYKHPSSADAPCRDRSVEGVAPYV